MTHRPIYLDNQATTPLDPLVLEAMMPYFTEKFGNPHSAGHAYGWEAEAGIDIAREQIQTLLNAQAAEEIIFTSGATEANNMAIKGVMQAYGAERRHLITVATEHKCVLEAAKLCARAGFELTVLDVDRQGMIDLDALNDALSDKTALVSVMTVHNEIGVIQDMKRIADLAHQYGALLHTDAAQAFGKIPLDVTDMGIDLMSISGHKIYGPKGIGCLYKRKGVNLVPQMHGGGQEGGLRSGTLSPALCAGLGKAAEIASSAMDEDHKRIRVLSEKLLSGLKALHPSLILNGHATQRWVGNLNISFPDIMGDQLLSHLRRVAVSSGSACSSGSGEGSYVLKCLLDDQQLIKSSLRIGIGRFTTDLEIDETLGIFSNALNKIGK